MTLLPVSRFGSCEALLEERSSAKDAPQIVMDLVYQSIDTSPKSRPGFETILFKVRKNQKDITNSTSANTSSYASTPNSKNNRKNDSKNPIKAASDLISSLLSSSRYSNSNRTSTLESSINAKSKLRNRTSRPSKKSVASRRQSIKTTLIVFAVLSIAGIVGAVAGYFVTKGKQASGSMNAISGGLDGVASINFTSSITSSPIHQYYPL